MIGIRIYIEIYKVICTYCVASSYIVVYNSHMKLWGNAKCNRELHN